ncbi:MAG: transposase, partial [Pseudomonadota bacterium]
DPAGPLSADRGAIACRAADRAYDTNAIRAFAAARGAWANIPALSTRKHIFSFSPWVYRQRNAPSRRMQAFACRATVERFFNRIKQFRGLATRYDRNPDNFLAAIKLAAIRICIADQ